jgi:hypothetical protein
MKLLFRRARKCGDPNYGSTEVGLDLQADFDPEVADENPERLEAFIEAHYALVDRMIEAEIARVYARRQQAAEPTREREPAHATNGNGNGYPHPRDGDREIDRARERDEPRNGGGYRNGDGASTKPRFDWNRNGSGDDRRRDDRDRPRDDRGGRRDDRRGGGGGGYGPPKTGKQLFAWARGVEEKGAEGFVKALGKWCKQRDLPWRFDDLQGDEVRDVYEAGQAMLEDQGGY